MENNIDSKQILVAIALIRNDKNEILLQKRSDPYIPEADKKWEFPGGKVEYGENPKDTAKRECLEEISCQIELTALLTLVQSTIWKKTDNKNTHTLVICYQAKIVKGSPVVSDKKVSAVKWFSENEIAKLDLLRGIKEFIDLSNKENT